MEYEALPMIHRDIALADANRFMRTAVEFLKQDAEFVGDDHSVGICSCSVWALYRQGLEWLHEYGDMTHTAIRELDGMDEYDNLVYVIRCSECGKELD